MLLLQEPVALSALFKQVRMFDQGASGESLLFISGHLGSRTACAHLPHFRHEMPGTLQPFAPHSGKSKALAVGRKVPQNFSVRLEQPWKHTNEYNHTSATTRFLSFLTALARNWVAFLSSLDKNAVPSLQPIPESIYVRLLCIPLWQHWWETLSQTACFLVPIKGAPTSESLLAMFTWDADEGGQRTEQNVWYLLHSQLTRLPEVPSTDRRCAVQEMALSIAIRMAAACCGDNHAVRRELVASLWFFKTDQEQKLVYLWCCHFKIWRINNYVACFCFKAGIEIAVEQDQQPPRLMQKTQIGYGEEHW